MSDEVRCVCWLNWLSFSEGVGFHSVKLFCCPVFGALWEYSELDAVSECISAYQCISCGDRAAPENAGCSRFVCAGDHGSGRCVPLLEPLCRTAAQWGFVGQPVSWMTARIHSCHSSTTAFAIASCSQDVVGAFVPHSSVETCRRPTASPWPRRLDGSPSVAITHCSMGVCPQCVCWCVR